MYANKDAYYKNKGLNRRKKQDDLELFNDNMNIDYLRNCFTSKKKNVSFIYRRKYSGDFFKTFVEFIPADEYRDDNQIVFCYVKNLH